MWQYALLEIYTNTFDGDGNETRNDHWPEVGTPADWVADGLVSWCDGDVDNFVACLPMRTILKYKLLSWAEQVRDWWGWRSDFWRCPDCGKWSIVMGVDVGDHEGCRWLISKEQ